MTLQESQSRYRLPSSIRLLTTPGVRGHSLVFSFIMAFLIGTAYASRGLGTGQAWTVIFAVGASTAGAYLVLSLLTLHEKTKRIVLYSRMKTRILLLALVFGPILAGVSYWIQQAGTVEAIPIFPAFIVVFYGWILLQAYFIATPISHILTRAETGITGEGRAKKIMRATGTTILFLPVVPLAYGIWAISSWLSSTYQNIQGASDKIITWTILVTIILLFTYVVSIQWGWRTIRRRAPQAAVFAGGTFLVLWGYLLYRATTAVIGYITQNQPSNPVLDTGLVIVSIVGAMQTFARKTINRADRRWSQVLPFLVFAFGLIYAVAQFYFILEFAITRVELSIAVNATVFATGIVTMMYLIRGHLLSVGSTLASAQLVTGQSLSEPLPSAQTKHSLFHLAWNKGRTETSQEPAAGQSVKQETEQVEKQEREEFTEQRQSLEESEDPDY